MSRPMSASSGGTATMIFDTDVLIWFWRGNQKAAEFVDAADTRSLSVVSYMELVRGARNRRELEGIKRFLRVQEFHNLPLSENVGHRAAVYMEEYGLRVALSVADALIAATAVENGQALATGSVKHLSMIEELRIEAFRPR